MADVTQRQIQEKINELYYSLSSLGALPREIQRTVDGILNVTKSEQEEYADHLKKSSAFQDDITKQRHQVLMDMFNVEKKILEQRDKAAQEHSDAGKAINEYRVSLDKAKDTLKDLRKVLRDDYDKLTATESERTVVETAIADLTADIARSKEAMSKGQIAPETFNIEQTRLNQELLSQRAAYATLTEELLSHQETFRQTRREILTERSRRSELNKKLKETATKQAEASKAKKILDDQAFVVSQERVKAEKVLLSTSNVLREHFRKAVLSLASGPSLSDAATSMFDAVRTEITMGAAQGLTDMLKTSYNLGLTAKQYAELSKEHRDVVLALGGTAKHIGEMGKAADSLQYVIGDIGDRTKYVVAGMSMLGTAGIKPTAAALANLTPELKKANRVLALTPSQLQEATAEFVASEEYMHQLRAASSEEERVQILKTIKQRMIEGKAIMGTTKSALEAAKALGQIQSVKPSERYKKAALAQQTMGILGLNGGQELGAIMRRRKETWSAPETAFVQESFKRINEAYSKAITSGNVGLEQAIMNQMERLKAAGVDISAFDPLASKGLTAAEGAEDALGEPSKAMAVAAVEMQQLKSVVESEIGVTLRSIASTAVDIYGLMRGGTVASTVASGASTTAGAVTGGFVYARLVASTAAAPIMSSASALAGSVAKFVPVIGAAITAMYGAAETYRISQDDSLTKEQKRTEATEAIGDIGMFAGMIAGAMKGGTVGTAILPGWGTLIGAVGGGLLGAVGGTYIGKAIGYGAGSMMSDGEATIVQPEESTEALRKLNNRIDAIQKINQPNANVSKLDNRETKPTIVQYEEGVRLVRLSEAPEMISSLKDITSSVNVVYGALTDGNAILSEISTGLMTALSNQQDAMLNSLSNVVGFGGLLGGALKNTKLNLDTSNVTIPTVPEESTGDDKEYLYEQVNLSRQNNSVLQGIYDKISEQVALQIEMYKNSMLSEEELSNARRTGERLSAPRTRPTTPLTI